MGVRNGFIWALIIILGALAFFFRQYRNGVIEMTTLWIVLLMPLFFIILAFIFFTGPNFNIFSPVFRPVFIAIIVIVIAGGFASTLGNDISQQLTANAVKPTDLIFTKEVMNLVFLLIVGITLFWMVLIKD